MTEPHKRRCAKCKRFLPDDQFLFVNNRYHHGYMSWCKKCICKDTKERRRRNTAKVQAWKLERGCAVCGYRKSAWSLDPHHASGKKYDIISNLYLSWKRLENELRKTIVYCKNCHGEQQERKYKERCKNAPVVVDDPSDDDDYDDLQKLIDFGG